MRISNSTRTLAGLALALIPAAVLATPPLLPTFVGDFNIPAGGQVTSSGPVGNWTASIDNIGGTAYVDTTSAPYSVSLFALAPTIIGDTSIGLSGGRAGLQGLVGSQIRTDLHIAAPSAGTFEFNFSVNSGTDVFAYDQQGAHQLVGDSSLVLTLDAGEVFGFYVESDTTSAPTPVSGGAKPMGLPGLAAPGSQGTTISGLVFTPVPEASTVGAGLALVGMGAFAWHRSRRRS